MFKTLMVFLGMLAILGGFALGIAYAPVVMAFIACGFAVSIFLALLWVIADDFAHG